MTNEELLSRISFMLEDSQGDAPISEREIIYLIHDCIEAVTPETKNEIIPHDEYPVGYNQAINTITENTDKLLKC